jgi:hypothetical protein
MKSALLVVSILIAAFIAGLLVARKFGLVGGTSPSRWPFHARKPLSNPEQALYRRLVGALPDHIVLAQVQVSRVLGVKKGFKSREWNNRSDRLSYDFVICGKDCTVIAAVELDDRSHDSESRRGVDARKDKASADAGLRLVRWRVGTMPTKEEIEREFLAASAAETASISAAVRSNDNIRPTHPTADRRFGDTARNGP